MGPSLPDGGTSGDTGERTEGAAVTGLLLFTLLSLAKLFLGKGWAGVFVPVLLCINWLLLDDNSGSMGFISGLMGSRRAVSISIH